MKELEIECWFDGACGPNNPGGYMGIGYVMHTQGGNAYISKGYTLSPDNTNNVAEQLALQELLLDLKNVKDTRLIATIYGDSQLTINQMTGRRKVKDKGLRYQRIAKENKNLIADLTLMGHVLKFVWIRREYNTEADKLSKQGINKVIN